MNRDTRRTRTLLFLLLLTSITLIAVDHRGGDESPLRGLRSFAAAVFGPVEKAASSIADPVSEAVDGVGSLGQGKDQAAELSKENEELRSQLRTSELARNRAAELDGLLRIAGAGRYGVVPAQVIAIGAAQTFSWTVTIDAGRSDGLRPDMTVINGDGLVGRVKTVGPVTATVLLIIDPQSAVGRPAGEVDGGRHRERTGRWRRRRPWPAAARRAVQASPEGDRLVSFGSHGAAPYVAGVPVGEVVQVRRNLGTLTRTATVRPFVDFSTLDLVGVVVEPPRKNPRDAVLPPRPVTTPVTPAPAVTVTVTAKPKKKSGS